MRTLHVVPIDQTPNSTVSQLLTDDGQFLAFVIEDGQRPQKVKHETRIPEGIYLLTERKYGGFYESYKRRFNHQYVLQLEEVSGFTDILIHIGNFVKDTSGCLLLNNGISKDDNTGNWRGQDSTRAYHKFYQWYKEQKAKGHKVFIQINRH